MTHVITANEAKVRKIIFVQCHSIDQTFITCLELLLHAVYI